MNMYVGKKNGCEVLSPKGIDYNNKFIGTGYEGGKFRGGLEEWRFVEVIELNDEQSIYKINETDKNDFRKWLEERSKGYNDETIIVEENFPHYIIKLKERFE